MRFSIRDLFWLTTLVAVITAWVLHEQARINREDTLQSELKQSRRGESAWRTLYLMANDSLFEQARFYHALNTTRID